MSLERREIFVVCVIFTKEQTEMLIELVKKYPIIYNLTYEYKNYISFTIGTVKFVNFMISLENCEILFQFCE